ncbi:MAG: head GIN domain-containing protein [Chitinophagales bacterium]
MKKILMSILMMTVLGSLSFAQRTINDPNAEKRNLTGFHAVEVADGIDLYLSQGEESVVVSASETKFREKINTEVENGVLKIWYGNHNSNININIGFESRKLKAYVSFKDLDKLIASGGSDVFVDGVINANTLKLGLSGGSDFEGKVDVNDMRLTASGGSDLKISGTAKNLDINASGGSDFKGYELAADICNLEASGGSDIYITINKELTAKASGGSDVYYKGNGSVREVRSSGSGSIKKVSK